MKKWRQLGSEPLQIMVESYLPYAIVREGKLVTKSNEPVNPAVQVLIRDTGGIEEKHSVFAVFPEFSTMHKNHRTDGRQFGVKMRMVSSAAKEEPAAAGARGRLELAQSADDSKLLYRVFAKSGETNASGEVKAQRRNLDGVDGSEVQGTQLDAVRRFPGPAPVRRAGGRHRQ